MAREIHADCAAKGLPVMAELPHDPQMVHAMVRGLAITEMGDSPMSRTLRVAWEKIVQSLNVESTYQ